MNGYCNRGPQVTEKKWLKSPHLSIMIRFLEQQAGRRRRLLLFGCACCRRVWDLLQSESARRIVELSEARADGEANETELISAADSPDFACVDSLFARQSKTETQLSARVVDALEAVRHLVEIPVDIGLIAQNTSGDKSHDFILSHRNNYGIGIGVRRDEAEFAEKARLLRDIFGNPFRPVFFDPCWRTERAVGLAMKIYSERDFSLLSALADTLRDAGCDNDAILNHCRGGESHVRGCWVIDLILDKR